jgi:hypothetical protein
MYIDTHIIFPIHTNTNIPWSLDFGGDIGSFTPCSSFLAHFSSLLPSSDSYRDSGFWVCASNFWLVGSTICLLVFLPPVPVLFHAPSRLVFVVLHMFFSFSMATIRTHGSFVPFILPHQDDGHVSVSEDLLSLRFNLQIGSMYLEQEMYSTDGEVYETILVQKNRTEIGFMWILGPGSFRVIGLSESQMQASTVILINESGTSLIQIPSIAPIKVESLDDSVFVLSDSEDDICASVDLSNTSPFPFKNVHSTPLQLPIHVVKSRCGLMYKKVVLQISPFQRPTLNFSPSSIWLTMVDALKLRKSRKTSKSDLASIDFDSIDVRDVKYLPSSLNGDVLFLLPLVALKAPSTYGRSMEGMDKMCDGHPWSLKLIEMR